MDDRKKMMIFWGVLIAVVIVVVIVAVVMMNQPKKPVVDDNNNQGNAGNEQQEGLAPNPDAKPEDKPSIGGNDNYVVADGIKVNTSEKIKEEKKYGIYTLSQFKLTSEKGVTKLSAKVTCTATEKKEGQDILIKFFNKDGTYISGMSAYIPQIKPGATVDLLTSSTSDLVNAYSLEIVADK